MYGAGRNRGFRYLLSVMAMTIALGAFTASPVLAKTELTPIYGVSEADEEFIYEDVDRWKETNDTNNHIVRWDDDILFIGKEATDDEIFYRWMKFFGTVF